MGYQARSGAACFITIYRVAVNENINMLYEGLCK
jgi:hypothetical protein